MGLFGKSKPKTAAEWAAVEADLRTALLAAKTNLDQRKKEIGAAFCEGSAPDDTELKAQLRALDDEISVIDAKLKGAIIQRRTLKLKEAKAAAPGLWEEQRGRYLRVHELALQISDMLKEIVGGAQRLDSATGTLSAAGQAHVSDPRSRARQAYERKNQARRAPQPEEIIVGIAYRETELAKLFEEMRGIKFEQPGGPGDQQAA